MSAKMMFTVFAAVFAVAAVVINGQDYEEDGIGLPGGSEDILSNPYDDSFSCEGSYKMESVKVFQCEIWKIYNMFKNEVSLKIAFSLS